MDIEKKFRLPKEIANEWLEALRSGNYNQTHGTLYNPNMDAYCCLGVICRIKYPLHYLKSNGFNNKNNFEYAGIIEKDRNNPSCLKYDLKKIPKELKGTIKDNKLVSILTEMNDEKGYDFIEIADWIEKNVEFY